MTPQSRKSRQVKHAKKRRKNASKQATQSKPHKKLNKRNRVLKFFYCSLACSPWLLSCFRMLGGAPSRAQKLFWGRRGAPSSDAATARRCL